ncbi:Phospholipid-transporting ATPase 10 [Coccomyxa sp. Obi]|nr:Phospholipid-transporting ATPase 10 [Coccomyxa sp. Obi]
MVPVKPHMKPPPNQPRVLSVNEAHKHADFKGNYVSTTKYNVFTYFPKALFEQFRPITTFLPLALVLGVSMAKEALEDFHRFQADREVNKRGVVVFNPISNTWERKQWRDIVVGEVIKVEKGSFFPADLLLLSSTNDDGIAYVETVNLDGESNLKIKKALDQTKGLTKHNIATFKGEIHCEQPNASLYTFTGNLVLHRDHIAKSGPLALSPACILLRGSSLRNTKSILGCTQMDQHGRHHCGAEQVMKNATLPPSKRSRIEHQMDKMILLMFALLFAMCLVGATLFALWTKNVSPRMWYLAPDNAPTAFNPSKPDTYRTLCIIIIYYYTFSSPYGLGTSSSTFMAALHSSRFLHFLRQLYGNPMASKSSLT